LSNQGNKIAILLNYEIRYTIWKKTFLRCYFGGKIPQLAGWSQMGLFKGLECDPPFSGSSWETVWCDLTDCANGCMSNLSISMSAITERASNVVGYLGSIQKVTVTKFLMRLLKLISNQLMILVFHLAALQLKNSIIVLALWGRK
jgi:hypothetical protein